MIEMKTPFPHPNAYFYFFCIFFFGGRGGSNGNMFISCLMSHFACLKTIGQSWTTELQFVGNGLNLDVRTLHKLILFFF